MMWERPFWEGVWPSLDPWDSVRFRTATTHWKYRAHGELFFFLIKEEEQVVASNEVLPDPFVSGHLKDPLVGLASALGSLENPHQGWHLVSQFVVASPLSSHWLAALLARRFCK